MTGLQWWQPANFARRKDFLSGRAQAVRAMRRFFESLDYVEVDTPCLQISPGMEVHLMAFATQLTDPYGGPEQTLHLHTSPEFAMKKLLVAGLPKIWQMAHVFRNHERSATHAPEFTMVEWYRSGASLEDGMDEICRLVRSVAALLGQTVLRRGDLRCDPFAPWQRLSIAQAFQLYAGIDILGLVGDLNGLAEHARRLEISVGDRDTWEDIFFKIMMVRIEPHLGMGVPTLLHSYPIAMAALARPCPVDPRVALRFELYACGVELANAFDELTDAAEQRRRFVADMDLRESLYQHRYPLDEDFLAALEQGLPPAFGCALGFDRLVMLLTGAQTIDQVLWTPVG